MKKSIIGFIFNRIEELGGKKYNHVGFEGEKEDFGELLTTIVPNIGDKKKVKITIELIEED